VAAAAKAGEQVHFSGADGSRVGGGAWALRELQEKISAMLRFIEFQRQQSAELRAQTRQNSSRGSSFNKVRKRGQGSMMLQEGQKRRRFG
jgi:hypothetical protein